MWGLDSDLVSGGTDQQLRLNLEFWLGNQCHAKIICYTCLLQDATDVQKNSSRWFSFDVKKDDLIFLERKSVPESLRQMECVESVMSVQSILSDLEDQGEAS